METNEELSSMKTNKNGEQLPAVGTPTGHSLLARMEKMEAMTPTKTELTAEESEAMRRLTKKGCVAKTVLAVVLGLKVNTLAYKIKNGTLSREEAEAIVKCVEKSLIGE